ncbi:MAG: tetratricopeptide repeat protein [Myxococcales bacterium]|nr:tetratricopeptide repeat protein [Myxococcales bacterium]
MANVLPHPETDDDYLEVSLVEADNAQLERALTVLGRLAHELREPARQWVRQVLEVDPTGRARAALAATVAVSEKHIDDVLGQELARALEGHDDAALAQDWEAQNLLPHQTVALREVKVWAYKQLRSRAASEELAARYAGLLGIALNQIGRREEALSATQEAVRHYRGLAGARPDAFLPGLAGALTNLGRDLSAVGDLEGAKAATQEAVQAYRQLAEAHPDAFLPNLADSLDNLGGAFSELDDWEGAKAATQEAVETYRQLADARPEEFLPDLARSLGTHGHALLQADETEAGVAMLMEGAQLLMPFFDRLPETYSQLMRSLVTLAARGAEGLPTPPAELEGLQERYHAVVESIESGPDGPVD